MPAYAVEAERLASLILAIAWHDPPWKPWGIRAEFLGTKFTLAGTGEGGFYERIARAVVAEMMRRGLAGAAEEFERLLDELNKTAVSGVESHERQSLVIAAAVAAVLKARGLEREAGVALEAGRLIASRNNVVKCSDVLASAMDRLVLHSAARALGLEPGRVKATEPVIVNPFNPESRIDLAKGAGTSLGVDLVAVFIVNYALALAEALKGTGEGDRLRLLRDLGFLLIEPLWYASVGEGYVPPADTRVPTHTVFDHVNAALATMLWCIQGSAGEPRGLITVIDLAGVQGWIRESRRLRDLWAASWLASLMAWKAVERLVDEFGPGVLVQPPARLHPFLAARLAGLAGDPEVEVHGRGSAARLRLSELLGLRHRWPLHPTVPATIVVALPPGVDVEREAERGVAEAWNIILRSAAKMLADALEDSGANGVKMDLIKDIAEGRLGLEPPLMLRISSYRVEDALGEAARRLAEAGLPQGLDPRDAAKAVYFQVAVAKAFRHLKEPEIKGPGRRLGRGYARYALSAYENGLPLCTICGKAPAVVDGRRLRIAAAGGRWLVAEIGGDRLCPYCLVKRLLRRALTADGEGDGGDLAVKVVGLSVRGTPAEERLRFGTVLAFTSRSVVGLHLLEKAATAVARDLGGCVLGAISGDAELLQAAMVENTVAGLEDPPAGVRADYWRKAVSLVLEASHDSVLARKLIDALKAAGCASAGEVKRMLEALARIRAKYAVLAADGDSMGAVRRGELPVETRRYIESVVNVVNTDVARAIADVYLKLVDTIAGMLGGDEAAESGSGGSCKGLYGRPGTHGPTVVVTPSYSFSLSRALAVQTSIDLEVVEKLGGMIIYAGGDDLLAILPPAVESEEGYAFPVADAARLTRLAYWGAARQYAPLKAVEGFNVARAGGPSIALAVTPAPAAHGRSYALYIVDSGLPMWLALEETRLLEDSKDEVLRLSAGGELGPCKDVLILASDSAGAAVLPWSLTLQPVSRHPRLTVVFEECAAHLASASLVRAGGRASLSPAFFYETLGGRRLIEEAAARDPALSASLIERSLSRHGDPSLPGSVVECLGLQGLNWAARHLYTVTIEASGEAGRLVEAGLGSRRALLLFHIIQAGRVLRGAL